MYSNLNTLSIFLACVTFITAQDYRPCPLLGPRFPIPVGLSSSKTVQAALANLTKAFDKISNSSNGSEFTATTPNTTSFSVALFATDSLTTSSKPYFFEYHHTAPSLGNRSIGVSEVNATSVYSVAHVTTVFTVYAMLLAVGDEHWLEPITKYIPELAESVGEQVIESVRWNDVRLIDLASNMAGIGRTASLDTLPAQNLPTALAALLPARVPISSGYAPANLQQLLDDISRRPPVYLPSATPIYSGAAFQLLALVVERSTGESFDKVLNENIFAPLGMSSSTLGTPSSDENAVVPVNTTFSGWASGTSDESAILAAEFMYSSISDLAKAGRAMLKSTLLSHVSTSRWLKPISQTSNAADDVGAPFSIYRGTLDGTSIGALVPIYTQFGTQGLYSSYFGLVPDWGVGFAILSADTEAAADLNAHVDLISTHLLPALEKAAIQEAALFYAGEYRRDNVTLTIVVDGFSGLSLTNWTVGIEDLRAAYAELNSIPPAGPDFRLYPTDLVDTTSDGSRRTFRAVLQDINAPIDAGTPTCISWMAGVDKLVYDGIALDTFVFELAKNGSVTGLEVPAFNLKLSKL